MHYVRKWALNKKNGLLIASGNLKTGAARQSESAVDEMPGALNYCFTPIPAEISKKN